MGTSAGSSLQPSTRPGSPLPGGSQALHHPEGNVGLCPTSKSPATGILSDYLGHPEGSRRAPADNCPRVTSDHLTTPREVREPADPGPRGNSDHQATTREAREPADPGAEKERSRAVLLTHQVPSHSLPIPPSPEGRWAPRSRREEDLHLYRPTCAGPVASAQRKNPRGAPWVTSPPQSGRLPQVRPLGWGRPRGVAAANTPPGPGANPTT